MVYLVEAELGAFTLEMQSKIPEQRIVVNDLFRNGKLLMYAVDEMRSKWWCAINAEDEEEVFGILGRMPIRPFIDPVVHPLMFYNGADQLLPGYSLN